MGDFVIVTLEGDDPAGAFKKFGQGEDAFTKWFVAQVKDIHGVDVTAPLPGPMPTLVRHRRLVRLRGSRHAAMLGPPFPGGRNARNETKQKMEETMGLVVIRSKVKDYATWRAVFDTRESHRAAAGLTNERVFHSADDRNEVVVLMDTRDTKTAKDLAASPTSRKR